MGNIIKSPLFAFFWLSSSVFLNSYSAFANDYNECIKNALSEEVPINKILSICREKLSSSAPVGETMGELETKSDYISTNKADEIIHKLIEEGELEKAGELAERLEIEKTKRIKAQAEAEALKAPELITNTTTNTNSQNSNNSSIMSTILLGNNPVSTGSAGSAIVTITTQGNHGALAGQYVTINNVNSSIDGIPASDLNKRHVISSIASTTTFTISVATSAVAGSVSGGGSDITAAFEY